MKCKNCDADIHYASVINGWCLPCVMALIDKETQFRVRGDMVNMAMAYDDWRAKPMSGVGRMIPIEEGLRSAFRSGWESRTKAAMLRMPAVPWCDLCGANDHDSTNVILKGNISAKACPNVIQPGPEWYERSGTFWGKGLEDLLEFQKGCHPLGDIVGMCPKCGTRIKPLSDGSGDFEACHSCGFGLPEDRIRPQTKTCNPE